MRFIPLLKIRFNLFQKEGYREDDSRNKRFCYIIISIVAIAFGQRDLLEDVQISTVDLLLYKGICIFCMCAIRPSHIYSVEIFCHCGCQTVAVSPYFLARDQLYYSAVRFLSVSSVLKSNNQTDLRSSRGASPSS